jgi:antitoxin ParD1/3/4
MNITLSTEQAEIIQRKLQSGRYQTIEDLMAQALQLLDDWDEHDLAEDPTWINATRQKVDSAVKSIETNGGHDGEAVVNQFLDKFRQARETQA